MEKLHDRRRLQRTANAVLAEQRCKVLGTRRSAVSHPRRPGGGAAHTGTRSARPPYWTVVTQTD